MLPHNDGAFSAPANLLSVADVRRLTGLERDFIDRRFRSGALPYIVDPMDGKRKTTGVALTAFMKRRERSLARDAKLAEARANG